MRREAGYVLLVVLLLAGLMVVTAAGYARHALVARHTDQDSLWVLESREAAASGVAWACRMLAVGAGTASAKVEAGGQLVSVELAEAGDGRRSLRVDAAGACLGTTLLGELVLQPEAGDGLPALSASAAAALATDPARTALSGSKTVVGATYAGTLVLEHGADIVLDGVVVHGAVVSRGALDGTVALGAPVRLVLRNGARIGPSALAPGVGLCLPDGALEVEPGCSIEVRGAIVAGTLEVAGDGACDGHIVAGQPFTLPAGLDRPGFGRAPPDWPAAFEVPAAAVARASFRHPAPSVGQLRAIADFDFGGAP